MVTVPEAAETIVSRSRYLSEAISKNLINLSSLARYIRPEIEEMLLKKVSEASILMALKRIKPKFKPRFQQVNIFTKSPEMIVRSDLVKLNVSNSHTLLEKLVKISDSTHQKYWFTVSKGVAETTCIISSLLESKLLKMLHNEKVLSRAQNLCSITITLPEQATHTPGIFYFFLKSLAWEGINIQEIISTQHELTLIVEEKNIHRAFSVLKSLFTK